MSSWKPLNHQPPIDVDTMLLLTDGSVMCHNYLAPDWYKLVPDAFSDYSNGSWHKLTPLPANAPLWQNGPTNAPLYFASAVLRDGEFLLRAGEYNSNAQPDMLVAEILRPRCRFLEQHPDSSGLGQHRRRADLRSARRTGTHGKHLCR